MSIRSAVLALVLGAVVPLSIAAGPAVTGPMRIERPGVVTGPSQLRPAPAHVERHRPGRPSTGWDRPRVVVAVPLGTATVVAPPQRPSGVDYRYRGFGAAARDVDAAPQ